MTEIPASDLAHPHLRKLAAGARANAGAAGALFDWLSERQLVWQPAAGVWSVAACVEHLVETGAAYYPRIAEGILRAKPLPASEAPPFRPTLAGRLFYLFVRPDRRWKVPTPPAFRPPSPEGAPEAGARFLDQQRELLALIRRADGRDLRAKFASPLARWLRFTVGEGLWLMIAHQQRHLRQAQTVLDHPRFPAT